MLTHLHVKNLALIREAEIDFTEGLNILTGETGAGKSIVIGSVSLALGGKAPREMVRPGAEYGLAELVFLVNRGKQKEKLLELGCKTAVLTGVSFEPGRLGAAYLDRDGKEFTYFTKWCEQSYHGTGDIFASTVTGALMRGLNLGDALTIAADYVVACIEQTAASESGRWYGAEFEPVIPKLCQMVEEKVSAI